MVNSAIGDHGNERHHTSPTPPHPLISLSLSFVLYDLLCLGQDCGLCQARPDKKIETTPAPSQRTLTVSCLFGIWPHISLTPGSLFLSCIHIQLVCLFSPKLLLYPEAGGYNCYYVWLSLNKSTHNILIDISWGHVDLQNKCWKSYILNLDDWNRIIFKRDFSLTHQLQNLQIVRIRYWHETLRILFVCCH